MAKYKSNVSASAKTYYSGMGYAVAHKKKGINFKSAEAKRIFQKGYNAGLRRAKNDPLKYPALPSNRKKKSR